MSVHLNVEKQTCYSESYNVSSIDSAVRKETKYTEYAGNNVRVWITSKAFQKPGCTVQNLAFGTCSNQLTSRTFAAQVSNIILAPPAALTVKVRLFLLHAGTALYTSRRFTAAALHLSRNTAVQSTNLTDVHRCADRC